ncbi:MAG: DUF3999 family protein [Planctomycetota bacterium]
MAIALMRTAGADNLPSDWERVQQFQVSAPGLVKLSLPVATLDAARPTLEDLRLFDGAGAELSFFVDRPSPAASVTQAAKSFTLTLNSTTTVITLETGIAEEIAAVTLETPAKEFFKSVELAGSNDGEDWQTLASGRPIFREARSAPLLRIEVGGAWRWLRFTVDDQRSTAIPFTGAILHAAPSDAPPIEPHAVRIQERHENPGETRLLLNLGAANLSIATLHFETTAPVFRRGIDVFELQVSESAIQESPLAQGMIYRVAIAGQPASANLALPVGQQVRSRELVVLVSNHDSAPLEITSVRAARRPVYLVFHAQAPGVHYLLTGNRLCSAPRYDLAPSSIDLKRVELQAVQISPLAANPSFRAPEFLPGVAVDGVALDVSAWQFRKAVEIAAAGVQQLELDVAVIARANPALSDLRLLREERQVPYLIERTSIQRDLPLAATAGVDAKDPKRSRWTLELPIAGIPVSRLTCTARTGVFQREVSIYEELSDAQGRKYQRDLGNASWKRTPELRGDEFSIALNARLQSDTIIMVMHNGDNPPLELSSFRAFYPATRLVFNAQDANDPCFLYYGNSRATAPRYDLSLVANRLFAASRSVVSLADEEQLVNTSWGRRLIPGRGGVIFFGILALVVVVLLFVIARMLPKPGAPPPEASQPG